MASLSIPAPLKRLLALQQTFIAIAVAIYVLLSVTMRRPGDPIVPPLPTLIYTLVLCNMTVQLQWAVSRVTARRPHLHWFIFIIALLLATPVMVVVSSALVFFSIPGSTNFWGFIFSGWQFPAVATLIFGIVSEIYRHTRERLEERNRELQVAVETETAQREIQEEELKRAREIQQGLIPKVIPQVPGFEIAGAWEPARIVGGDYFDVIRLSDSKLGICIADVVGKGVSAALLMANVQATVRAFASEGASPSWLCERVNSVLCSNIATGKFVTLFYGVLDSACRTLTYTSAGHLPPILIDSSGVSRTLNDGGALLGVFPTWKYEDATIPLAQGDRVVLFTDGITEAMSANGEEFGEERLADVASSRGFESAELMNSSVMTEVKSFCHAQLHDDATLIVISAN